MRSLAILVFCGAAVSPTAAFAHPHVVGDPFADVGDTIVAGSPRLAPIHAPSQQRWTISDVRDGGRVPLGTLEQRVSREDSPAGRQWCVAIERRDVAGVVTVRDSIWVSAGAPIPIYEWWAAGIDTVEKHFDGRSVTGSAAHASSRRMTVDHLALAAFPRGLDRLLLGQLRLAPGAGVAVDFFDPEVGGGHGESMLAIQSAGETVLARGHGSRSCVLLAVSEAGTDAVARTVWIDRATHALLREEIRTRSGDLLEVLEAE